MVRLHELIALLAMLLMPLGMPSAAAASSEHHSASMPMQHCPEQGTRHDSKAASAECTMACSAALPAIAVAMNEPPSIDRAPDHAAIAQVFHGLHPETATPPPKAS